jgi:hypothetical protein
MVYPNIRTLVGVLNLAKQDSSTHVLAQDIYVTYNTLPSVNQLEPEKNSIRLDLEGEMSRRFNQIKNKMGIKSNAELIRLLISQEYQRQFGD